MTTNQTQPPITYHALTIDELRSLEFPPLEYIVDGILPSGSFTLFAAREKSGKSLMATDLAVSVAAGEPFLDRAVIQGPAILAVAEEHLRDVRSRIETRLNGVPDPPLYILRVNQGEDDRLDLANSAALAALRTMIIDLEPALVVLDPFRELHQLSENDSDQMGPLLQPLRNLAHQTDTAIVLIHHMSRNGSFRGSTAIRAACDQEWAFRRPEDQAPDNTELRGTMVIEGRYGPRQTLGLRLDENLRWQLTVQAMESSPSARQRIIDYLRAMEEPVSAAEISGVLGIAIKTVQNVLSEERRQGHLRIETLGAGRRGDPFRYARADDDTEEAS
jgi:hypothetical protein